VYQVCDEMAHRSLAHLFCIGGIILVALHRNRQQRRNSDVCHMPRKNGGLSRSASRKNSRNRLQCRDLTTANGTDDFVHAPGGKDVYTRSLRSGSRGRRDKSESRCFFEVRLRDGHAGEKHAPFTGFCSGDPLQEPECCQRGMKDRGQFVI